MKTKAWISRFAAVGGAVVALSLPLGASAQTAPDYPGGAPPQVLGESLTKEVPTQVLGESVSRGGPALPVTGADIAGLVALGAGAIATGTVLVRRSRVRST